MIVGVLRSIRETIYTNNFPSLLQSRFLYFLIDSTGFRPEVYEAFFSLPSSLCGSDTGKLKYCRK